MMNCQIDPAVRGTILGKLKGIEERERVKILFAIESGSRAWGFPSPDSDYDVRFVYAHPVDWYLTIHPGRDVLELPLEDEWDINGWNIKKALELLMKPNPVLLEWLASPIRYMWDEDACASINELASEIAHAQACLYHYLNLGARQWRAYIEGKEEVNLKKYLYVVRPAMAIRWIRMQPDKLPPMNFYELKDGVDLPESLDNLIEVLISKKRESREMGLGASVTEINQFILEEFEWARDTVKTLKSDKKTDYNRVDKLFRTLIKR